MTNPGGAPGCITECSASQWLAQLIRGGWPQQPILQEARPDWVRAKIPASPSRSRTNLMPRGVQCEALELRRIPLADRGESHDCRPELASS